MYLKIKKAKLQPTSHGNSDLVLSMIGLYEDDGKYIKRVKLNQELIDQLIESKIILPKKEKTLFSNQPIMDITFNEFLTGHDITPEEYKTSDKEFQEKCIKCYNEYVNGDMEKDCLD